MTVYGYTPLPLLSFSEHRVPRVCWNLLLSHVYDNWSCSEKKNRAMLAGYTVRYPMFSLISTMCSLNVSFGYLRSPVFTVFQHKCLPWTVPCKYIHPFGWFYHCWNLDLHSQISNIELSWKIDSNFRDYQIQFKDPIYHQIGTIRIDVGRMAKKTWRDYRHFSLKKMLEQEIVS